VEDLLREATAYLKRIAAATPERHAHDVFVIFAEQMLMAERNDIDLWAAHPDKRSILDAAEKRLEPRVDVPAPSCEALSCFGNMSPAPQMFVLQWMMQQSRQQQCECAMSSRSELTVETMRSYGV
jgi:predicted naringenin-chalcone synthase